jgi:hypothetical protein
MPMRRPFVPASFATAPLIRLAASFLMLSLLVGLCAMPRPARAAASYDNCTGFITSLPSVIDTPGIWCLKQDLATAMSSGTAILINSDNVTIDCNNYKLGGLAAGEGTQAWGIGEFERRNITIRRCNVRGFYYAIVLSDSNLANGGHLIEDNRLDNNTAYGIVIAGNGSIVRRNLINDTGFTTLDGGGQAINANGWVDILDNTVAGVTATSTFSPRAISVSNDSGSIIGNRVSGVVGGSGPVGIEASFSSNATIRDNNLSGTGIGSGTGIYCQDSNGVAKDNVVNNMGSFPIYTCSDGGGNDIAP